MSEIPSIRAKLKLSQAEFATLIGVNQSTVSRWESGQSSPSELELAGVRAKAAEAIEADA